VDVSLTLTLTLPLSLSLTLPSTHSPNPTPNPISNPIFNRNTNPNRKPNTKPAYAKPDARTKKYLAFIRNYCSAKTTHLQAENKHMTKANLYIRLQTSDHSFFRYNVNEI